MTQTQRLAGIIIMAAGILAAQPSQPYTQNQSGGRLQAPAAGASNSQWQPGSPGFEQQYQQYLLLMAQAHARPCCAARPLQTQPHPVHIPSNARATLNRGQAGRIYQRIQQANERAAQIRPMYNAPRYR